MGKQWGSSAGALDKVICEGAPQLGAPQLGPESLIPKTPTLSSQNSAKVHRYKMKKGSYGYDTNRSNQSRHKAENVSMHVIQKESWAVTPT